MPQPLLSSPAYGWLLLLGIAVSLGCWWRLGRRDGRLRIIYMGALFGAFFGAKVVYLLAEGWLHLQDADRWLILATGKSILGALLGGYAGVELAKRLTGYTSATGDLFALVAPLGIMLGRIGCVLNGCCLGRVCAPAWFTVSDRQGIDRWPAAQAEFAFNFLVLLCLLLMRSRRLLPRQLFHVYLMVYGLFRFVHEFWRETPKIAGPFSGYHFAALFVTTLGVVGFVVRRQSRSWQSADPDFKTHLIGPTHHSPHPSPEPQQLVN